MRKSYRHAQHPHGHTTNQAERRHPLETHWRWWNSRTWLSACSNTEALTMEDNASSLSKYHNVEVLLRTTHQHLGLQLRESLWPVEDLTSWTLGTWTALTSTSSSLWRSTSTRSSSNKQSAAATAAQSIQTAQSTDQTRSRNNFDDDTCTVRDIWANKSKRWDTVTQHRWRQLSSEQVQSGVVTSKQLYISSRFTQDRPHILRVNIIQQEHASVSRTNTTAADWQTSSKHTASHWYWTSRQSIFETQFRTQPSSQFIMHICETIYDYKSRRRHKIHQRWYRRKSRVLTFTFEQRMCPATEAKNNASTAYRDASTHQAPPGFFDRISQQRQRINTPDIGRMANQPAGSHTDRYSLIQSDLAVNANTQWYTHTLSSEHSTFDWI